MRPIVVRKNIIATRPENGRGALMQTTKNPHMAGFCLFSLEAGPGIEPR